MQHDPDTGQQPNYLPPRRRTSSIPRPTPPVITNVESFRTNAQASSITSPLASTPDALNFYKNRKPLDSPITSNPNRPFDPSNSRSVSGPTLKTATSSPTIAQTNRMEKSSFKDLVARFNETAPPSNQAAQPRPPRNRTIPSPASNIYAQNSSSAVELSSPTSGRPGATRFKAPPSSNEASRSFGYEHSASNTRRREVSHIPRPSISDQYAQGLPQQEQTPLFGEVVPGQNDANAGYGISPRQRRGSEGSMRSPNAMFPPDTSIPDYRSPKSFGSDVDLSPQHHARTRSDMVNGSPRRNLQESPQSNGRSRPYQTSSRTTPRTGSPQSRIPLPRSSGYGSPNPPPRPNFHRPSTPPNLQPSRSFAQLANGSQVLHAIINAPIQQKSPPLRSSRPRQDVNSARSISPGIGVDRGANADDNGSPRRRKASLDVMSRQDSIRRAMRAKTSFDSPQDSLPRPRQTSSSRSPDLSRDAYVEQPFSQAGAREPPAHLRPTTYQRPGLKINVHDVSRHDNDAPNTGITQFEEDDSPVLGLPGSFPDSDEATSEREQSTKPRNRAGVGASGEDAPPIPFDMRQNRSRTVLSQIMESRGLDTPSSYTTGGSPALGRDDAGTIQIMLGNTPAQDSAGSDWYRRELYTGGDPAGRSLAPSIHSPPNLSPSPWTPSKSDIDSSSLLTHESDTYSAINRILDQYRQSGVVSPEMVHEFHNCIRDVDPEFARDERESMIAARAALEDILKDHNRALALSNEAGALINAEDDGHSPQFPSKETGQPWQQRDEAQDTRSGTSDAPFGDIEPKPGNASIRSEAGPTPPPKDDMYSSLVAPLGKPIAPVVASEKPLLPETPHTNGSLGLNGTPSLASITSLSSAATVTQIPALAGGLIPSSNAASSSGSSMPGGKSVEQPPVDSTPLSEASTKAPLVTPARNPATELGNDGAIEARDSAIGPWAQNAEKVKTAAASPAESIDGDTRRLTKRRNVIKELIDTEASYNQDMKVIEDIYKGTTSACDALTADDCRVLFGNSGQIVTFSEDFLAALKKAGSGVYVMPPSNKWRQNRGSFSTSNSARDTPEEPAPIEPTADEKDRKTYLGETFNQHMTLMEELYTNYLRNHDYANQRLKKLQEIPKVKMWLNECHTYAVDITSAWDLDSLLVKPVQRILKYPLLLKGLLECTPEDHPDYGALKKAVKEMMDASYRINESKKRAEVLEQVMKNTKRKEFDISKLVGRRTDKLRQQVGLSDAVEDAEYKKLAQRFETRYVHLQIVMRDFEVYKKSAEDFMNQFSEYMRAVESMVLVGPSHSPEMESKWRKLVLTIREMHSIAHADHDAAVSRHCIEPILSLIKLHEAPQKLMMKRKKRIVEYARYFTQKNKGEKIDKKTQEQGEQFIALNETLKDELPKLFNLSSKLIEVCLTNFLDLQVYWHSIWQRKIKAILEEQEVPKSVNDIIDAFNADFSYVEAHVLSLGICNGSLLADVSNFLSSSTASFTTEETLVASKRPSTNRSLVAGDQSPNPRESDRLSGTSFPHIQTNRSSSDSQRKGLHQQVPNAFQQERFRTSSNVSTQSTRNPSRSVTATGAPYVPHQDSRQARSDSLAHSMPNSTNASSTTVNATAQPTSNPAPISNPTRTSSSSAAPASQPARPLSSSTFHTAMAGPSASTANLSPNMPSHRRTGSGGPFSSAMPMDSRPSTPASTSSHQQAAGGARDLTSSAPPSRPQTSGARRDYHVLFLAASLYEFSIEHERSEAGYPYLFYTPGEVFDVIGQKGELWLARNQDDPDGRVGWIWEKHFARLLVGEDESAEGDAAQGSAETTQGRL